MTVFEYLSVAVSIVLALGIGHVLGGLSMLARRWRYVSLYWVHLVWTVLILVLHVQIWWAYWDFSGDRSWNLARFAAMLAVPGMLYFLAHMIVPESTPENRLDLRAYFGEIRVPFFLALAVLWAYLIVWRAVAFGDPLFLPRRGPQAVLLLLALAGAAREGPRWLAGVTVASAAVWAVLLWHRLLLGVGID